MRWTEAVDYQVRAARITDIDRLVALSDGLVGSRSEGTIASADLLRRLVYIAQASVLVAEGGHGVVGGLVLALRPSVRSRGYVGTVDLQLAEVEGLLIGAEKMDDTAILATASSIRDRTREIEIILK